MSADLFDFHGGGDGVEPMKDGENGKLTRLNPMRNVGPGCQYIFFFHTVSHQSEVSFQLLLAAAAAAVSNGDIAFPELS